MNEIQKEIFRNYLSREDIRIEVVTFLKGGEISADGFTVHYYEESDSEWYLVTDNIFGEEVKTRRIKVNPPR